MRIRPRLLSGPTVHLRRAPLRVPWRPQAPTFQGAGTHRRLLCLTRPFDIANAKRFGQHGGSSHVRQGNSHPANITKRNGIRPHFVISGQNADVKNVLRHRKEKSHEADCKTNCYKPTQTTTKGNPTQPTAAGNMTPTVNITPASAAPSTHKKGFQPGAKER